MKYSKLTNALLSVIVLASFVQSVNVAAQQFPHLSGCGDHTPPTNKPGWQQGTTNVDVWIDPAITGNRLAQVQTAFNNWTQSRGANGSGITYVFVGGTEPQDGQGFKVKNQTPPGSNPPRIKTFTYPDGIAPTTGAVTYLSPTITDPDAVLEAMSHDIGHPAGFDDCDDCEKDESVMATKDRYTNDNEVIGRTTSPTPCDNERLYLLKHPNCYPTEDGVASDRWCVYCCCWVTFADACDPPSTGGGSGGGGGGGGGGGTNCTYGGQGTIAVVNGDCEDYYLINYWDCSEGQFYTSEYQDSYCPGYDD